MRMYDLIELKKRGGELSREQIFEMVSEYSRGAVPDYQMSAFLMATYFRGMTDAETVSLTEAMLRSGDLVDLSEFGCGTVDKHSTGGVGDKTTLIIAPIVAACGGVVAKMSGRGLGHTGGTVDKLESIPGFRTSLTPEEFRAQVKEHGIAVIGQSARLAPADKKLYALRDVTATVDSVPLIASSIMSKKLASGTRSVVLDVKWGKGAFMKTPEAAYELADSMVKIGRAHGRRMSALITDMNSPLGCAVGNSLEVFEAVEVLRGRGPEDLRTVATALAGLMLKNSLGIDASAAAEMARCAISSGAAYLKFKAWISAQGGEVEYIEKPELLGEARHSLALTAKECGYVRIKDAELIGRAAMTLGAGRRTAEDVIDPRAGIILKKKTGDFVSAGDTVAVLYTERPDTLDAARALFESAYEVPADKPEPLPLIYKMIE